MARYETLRQLAAAYRNGEIPAANPVFIEGATVWVHTGDGVVFRAGKDQVLVEALALLDIPYDDYD